MAGASKRILRETTQQTVTADGELIEEKRVTESYVTPEPEFIKLYLQHVLMLKKLPKSHHDVLMGVLKEMNWNNRVYLAGKLKRDMLAYLGISLASFDKALKSFVTEGILFQEERGLYVVNPHIFGKGKWEEIKKIRLSVTYDSSGGTFSAVIDKAKNKSFPTL